jgi:hypothetical protein
VKSSYGLAVVYTLGNFLFSGSVTAADALVEIGSHCSLAELRWRTERIVRDVSRSTDMGHFTIDDRPLRAAANAIRLSR